MSRLSLLGVACEQAAQRLGWSHGFNGEDALQFLTRHYTTINDRWKKTAQALEQAAEEQKARNDEDAHDAKCWRWLLGQHTMNSPLAQVVWKRGDDPEGSVWVNVINHADLIARTDRALGWIEKHTTVESPPARDDDPVHPQGGDES